jgi:hypothetical protein
MGEVDLRLCDDGLVDMAALYFLLLESDNLGFADRFFWIEF